MNDESLTDLKKAIEEGVDRLDTLNTKYPNLADDYTRETVERMRRGNLVYTPPTDGAGGEEDAGMLAEIARELVSSHGLDDAIDILLSEHQTTLNLLQLANLIGRKAYRAALLQEAAVYQDNLVSLEQMAQLWNEFSRPPLLGESTWTAKSISILIE